jgi:hypothetical protein
VAEFVPKREGEAGTRIRERREARRRRTMKNIKSATRRMAAMTPPAIPPASNTDAVELEEVERLAMPMDVWNVLSMRSIKKMLEII